MPLNTTETNKQILLICAGKALKLCSGITQFYLPPTRFIPARAGQDLEHFIRNELLDVAAHFTDLKSVEAQIELSVPGFEPQTSITLCE